MATSSSGVTPRRAVYSPVDEKVSANRFSYRHVLGRHEFSLRMPLKRSGGLPDPLARSERGRLLEAPGDRKQRVLLMTADDRVMGLEHSTHPISPLVAAFAGRANSPAGSAWRRLRSR